uniref:hypothetical protein n=1 Tax=Pseudomonas sp. RA_5y_Pfl1_P24 TaxID=3088706 RepID=UPI0030D9B967
MNTTLAVLSLTALLAPVLSQAAEAPISAKQYQSVFAGSWRDPAKGPSTAIGIHRRRAGRKQQCLRAHIRRKPEEKGWEDVAVRKAC